MKAADQVEEQLAVVQMTPVSPKMNNPYYNEPDCIEPLAPAASAVG